jgi:hypothetical protein
MLALLQEEGLTLRKVLADIPHDLPALVVYVLVGLFVGSIWYANRSQSKAGGNQ